MSKPDLTVLLPWERPLWSGRPHSATTARWSGESYDLTEFRVIVRRGRGGSIHEIAIHDVARIEVVESRLQRWLGCGTLFLRSRRPGDPPIALRNIRRPAEVANRVCALIAGGDEFDATALVVWPSHRKETTSLTSLRASAAIPLMALPFAAVAIGLQGQELPIAYPADDAIYPSGVKRSEAEIRTFMEHEVMPFAREILGPVVGGAHRVTCQTCHGSDAEARGWRMPGVQALPEPDVRGAALERYGPRFDPWLRNAVYGDLAQDDRQHTAVYMRAVVMREMARLLRRPSYDFTRSYNYNRSRFAFGCYHCHRADSSVR